MIYKDDYALHKYFDDTTINGGFLNLSPSNAPVQVKVRIYIVKAKVNPIRTKGCDPYLSIKYGDNIVDDKTSCRKNTDTPIFGQ